MDTPLSKEEIESVLDYHFPQKLTLSILPESKMTNQEVAIRSDAEKEINREWEGEREVAITKCVEDINRRITERIREY